MKKSLLLLSSMALMAGGVQAQETFPYAKIFEQCAFTKISPKGDLVLSNVDGFVDIFNLVTGEKFEYGDTSDEGGVVSGNGNAISDNGIILIYNRNATTPGYWKNGEITLLPVKDAKATNMNDGITPDGRIIVGSTFHAGELMTVPVYWELGEDGTYKGPFNLPFPEKDWTGSTPMYINAISVSDDGNVIGGCMVDYAGMRPMPIVFTRDDKGEWSYKLVCESMANPDGIVFPENPGDCPEQPDPLNYMSAEELATYNADHNAWLLGGCDPEKYPDPINYLSDEELKKYEEDYNNWDKAYTEWKPKADAYYDARNRALSTGMGIVMNKIIISKDGKKIYSTAEYTVEDPNSLEGFRKCSSVIVFDIESNTYKMCENQDFKLSDVGGNGEILGYEGGYGFTDTKEPAPFILMPDSETPVSLYEYINSKNPEAGEWMKNNMVHMTIEFEEDPETGEFIEVEKESMLCGIAFCSEDLKVFATELVNTFDADPFAPDFYGYVLYADKTAGVEGVATDAKDFGIQALKGGIVKVNGIAEELSVYSIDGRIEFEAENVSGEIATGVESGIYMIKATFNGEEIVRKAIF